jgi:sugar lactone lactonase YvrE
MIGAPHCICRVGAMLGEGPVWDAARGCLWFVDIKCKRVFSLDPATAQLDVWDAPRDIGWVLPGAGGTLVAGLQGRIAQFDPVDGSFVALVEVEPNQPGNRLNDATTDRAGRLWFGTMDNAESSNCGRLYRLEEMRPVDSGLPPIAITNGPAFSPDGGTLYHTDTLGRAIYAVPVDADSGVGKPRLFARIDPADGYPDGPTVDSAGNVWTGLFGGWGVHCYAPDGALIQTVRFPVANVTKIAFGGADLRTAYATTARKGLDDLALAAQPDAGDLFAFHVDIPGLPIRPVHP